MAFDFERALLEDSRPELGVVADYFLRLKVAAPTDPPDTTGALEGQFAVPIANVLQLLAELVKNEMETVYAYTVYGQTLRDLSHDSIADHFEDHAGEEMDHAQFLLKRMAVLGGGANVPDLAAPHPSTDPCDIIQTMIRMEQEGIAGWQKLLKVVGDNPMRIKAEEYMAAEQEHLDDLWQLLKPMANPTALVSKTSGALSNYLVGGVPGIYLGDKAREAGVDQGDAALYPQLTGAAGLGLGGLAGAGLGGLVGRGQGAMLGGALGASLGGIGGIAYGVGKKKEELDALIAAKNRGRAKQASKEEREAGRSSAERATAARFERERHTKGERSGDLVGRIAGAVLGGSTHALHKNAPASVGAAAVGQHIGSKVGREIGRRIDEQRFKKESAVFGEHTEWPSGDPADAKVNAWINQGNFDRAASRTPEAELAWNSQGQRTKSANAYIGKMAWALKRAFDEMAGSNANVAMAGMGTGSGQTTMAAGPQADEPGSEQQPSAAPQVPQSPLSDPGLTSFLHAEHAGTMAELQQQSAYYKQLAEQAQQAAQSSGEQLQQVQQQVGDLQQQVQTTQQQIDQSMQQAQQVQQQAMQTAQSAQQIAAQSQQAHLQAVNESMMHRQMSEQMKSNVATMKAAIQSALQQDPTQGIEMQLGPAGQAPTAGPEVQPGGPAAGAPAQELPPGAAPPDGEAPPQTPAEAGGGPAMEGAAPAGELKTSGAKAEMLKRELKKRAPYMAGGAALGAGITALGRPHSGKTKRDVEKSEAKGGGAARDLNTAKHKIRHALAEYVDKHPVAGSALMGGAAAGTVGSVGPTLVNVAKGYIKHRKGAK